MPRLGGRAHLAPRIQPGAIMLRPRFTALVAGSVVLASHAAAGQLLPIPRPTPPIARHVPAGSLLDDDNRSGPRFGVAALIGGSVTAERAGHPIQPITTLFGWQAERQFRSGSPGPVPVTEIVGLVGGMEQGAF